MRCTKCQEADTKVIESRDVAEGQAVRRRRCCTACEHRFTTYERQERPQLVVIKNDGNRQLFSRCFVRTMAQNKSHRFRKSFRNVLFRCYFNVCWVDLEFLARHRGSAFGFECVPQPQQAQFENLLAQELLRLENQIPSAVLKPILLEDESRLIGQNVIPEALFGKMP